MQHRSCDDIGLLISKYADGEATHEEREAVDLHVSECSACARKLTEYMEFAAIFAEAPMRSPEPDLRANLFREIGNIKEEARRKDAETLSQPSWQRWLKPSRARRGRGFSWAGAWEVASPFAAVGFAVIALVAFVLVNGARQAAPAPDSNAQAVTYPPVPTLPATVVYSASSVPPAAGTKLANVPALASASVVVQATAAVDGGDMLQLEQNGPLMETESGNGDWRSVRNWQREWHVLRDPTFGFTISYPPNWWVQVRGTAHVFFPWSQGGTQYPPFWIEMSVQPNLQHLTADMARRVLFNGQATPSAQGELGSEWLRVPSTGDDTRVDDDIYAYDTDNIYHLHLTVPILQQLGDFPTRWAIAQDIFSKMSQTVAPGKPQSRVLFLNGGDLWSVDATGQDSKARPVWQGNGRQWVRHFALSPDSRLVAFDTTDKSDDPWATTIYLTSLDAGAGANPLSLPGAIEVHDVAWYSDHELLAIAKTDSGLGIYRFMVGGPNGTEQPQLLAKLNDEQSGARGLQVSPDRQLISFLAPIGESKGTDVYAVRPDGSNMVLLVSHTDAVTPAALGSSALSRDNQAVKSYLWVDGRLEPSAGGYAFNVLYTLGNAESPSLYRGGYMYGAPGDTRGTSLLDPRLLRVEDAPSVQIVQMAYSPATGKVAFSGFYNIRNMRVESLAGLWVADLAGGTLQNVTQVATSSTSTGLSDLQWSPNGMSLIYREIALTSDVQYASRYDAQSPFKLVRVDLPSGQQTTLYNSSR